MVDQIEELSRQTYNLNMNDAGFGKFQKKLTQYIEHPQIYIHRVNDTVVRIGKAENGVLHSWITASRGYATTFSWAVKRYIKYKKFSPRFPENFTFFASLYNAKSTVEVITYHESDKKNLGDTERHLIETLKPVWEVYKKRAKNLLNNEDKLYESALKFGGALEVINKIRKDKTFAELDVMTYINK